MVMYGWKELILYFFDFGRNLNDRQIVKRLYYSNTSAGWSWDLTTGGSVKQTKPNNNRRLY